MNDNGGKVIALDVITRLDIPAERVLSEALKSKLSSVVVTGYDKDGNEYFASSLADGADALWLLKRCEKRLLEIGDGE